MNLVLFTAQLQQLLETAAESEILHGVCGLLRAHTGASVRAEGRDGRVLAECFSENAGEGAGFILKIGGLTLRRENLFAENFSDDEKLAANIALCVCTVLSRHRDGLAAAEKKRRAAAVRTIINSLSFSELDAATHIFREIENGEGLLVAGKIADKHGFARSVITGALRKLEGAGLIETRSLGMKGTYIRVKDALLTEEFSKL